MAVVLWCSSSQRYSGLKDWISQYVRKDDNILMVGCGNSRLSEDMFDDGFITLTNIDVSRVVIDQMIARYRCISTQSRESNGHIMGSRASRRGASAVYGIHWMGHRVNVVCGVRIASVWYYYC